MNSSTCHPSGRCGLSPSHAIARHRGSRAHRGSSNRSWASPPADTTTRWAGSACQQQCRPGQSQPTEEPGQTPPVASSCRLCPDRRPELPGSDVPDPWPDAAERIPTNRTRRWLRPRPHSSEPTRKVPRPICPAPLRAPLAGPARPPASLPSLARQSAQQLRPDRRPGRPWSRAARSAAPQEVARPSYTPRDVPKHTAARADDGLLGTPPRAPWNSRTPSGRGSDVRAWLVWSGSGSEWWRHGAGPRHCSLAVVQSAPGLALRCVGARGCRFADGLQAEDPGSGRAVQPDVVRIRSSRSSTFAQAPLAESR
jgi:hypothetical protein